jgi:histidine triad (HIT) family protein
MSTIFSRIVSGEIPAAKLYEDELTLAFLDVNPASRGHSLVICKEERPDLFSLTPELIAAVGRTTQIVGQALMAALKPDGLNVVQNNGAAAGQTVFHYHVHLIPRWDGDRALGGWKPGTITPDELRALAAQIGAELTS